MFAIDTAIDAIQSTKKQAINTFVPHSGLKEILIDFVDAQSKYTKHAAQSMLDTGVAIGALMTNKQFYEDCMKSFVPGTVSKR